MANATNFPNPNLPNQETQNQNQNDPVISLNLPVATKLSHTNFLTWKSQIIPLLKGFNLGQYLVADNNGTISERQDQLILAWMRSSLTEQIQAQVVSCETTATLWLNLVQMFSATSRARLTDLRRQLQTTTKGSSSCSEYLQQLRHIADELIFIGSPLPDDDLVSSILNGLGAEYNPFVIAVTTASRHSPLSFSDLHGLLTSHEHLLQKQTLAPSPPSIENPAAFATRFASGQHRSRFTSPATPSARYHPSPITSADRYQHPIQTDRYQHPNFTRPPLPSFGPPSQPISASSYPRPSVENRLPSGPRPQCQICLKFGHTAKICYYRFSEDRNSSQPPSTYHAYMVQPAEPTYEASPDHSDWILDSGATNHVTSDINNLSSFFAYEGSDNLQIGNGKGLPISNIGFSLFNISTHTIKLTNILHVPHFSKNLISLSQLLLDNPHLIIEFTPSSCSLKPPS